MKNFSIFFSLLFFQIVNSQNPNSIGLSKDNLTVLMSNKPIDFELTDLGNISDFILIETTKPNVLKIKCITCNKSDKSNLIVFLENGETFEYDLFITDKLSKRVVRLFSKDNNKDDFIDKKNVINNKYSYYSNNVENKVLKNKSVQIPPLEFSKNLCDSLIGTKPKIFSKPVRKAKTSLALKNILYENDILYFLFSVKNKNTVNFDIDNVSLSIGTKKTISNSTRQLNKIKILSREFLPNRIDGNSSKDFVIPVQKFTIDKSKCVEVVVAETKGERDLVYLITPELINNPTTK